MKESIKKIIESVPSGCIFDTHFVINQMIKHYSDSYLECAMTKKTANGITATIHGLIGKEIKTYTGTLVDQIGESWSENIRGNVNKCASWKRL